MSPPGLLQAQMAAGLGPHLPWPPGPPTTLHPLTVYRQLHLSPCGACFVGGLAGEEACVARLHVVDEQCGPLRGHLHPHQLLGWAAVLQPPKVGGKGDRSA